MITRIEVGFRREVPDGPGDRIRKRIAEEMSLSLKEVRVLSTYLISIDLSPTDFEQMAREAFYDPVVQDIAIDAPLRDDADFVVEVGFKPGVTDNVGKTARQVIQDYLGRPLCEDEGVYTATTYLLYGDLGRNEAEQLAWRVLGNPLIHRFLIFKGVEWMALKIFPLQVQGTGQ